ncbi:MAG TPA: response regulator transcription factor [Pseudonocardiaceae bacterium]|nr:response regulator transcription factor [Pseudonocardiaceae bacterium]
MIRVVLVDDQALVRLGLRTLFAAEPDIDVVGEAADGVAAVAEVRRVRPDVVLMDVRMPEMDGIEALRVILADPDLAGVRVIVLTTFEIDEYVFDALRSGASGFVVKNCEPGELLRAVRVVAAGESLLSPTVTRTVIARFAGTGGPVRRTHPGLAALTEREREIVGWVAAGLSNAEIGTRLVVSPATVRTHVSRAMAKMQARDRTQLVVFAYQHGLPVPEP